MSYGKKIAFSANKETQTVDEPQSFLTPEKKIHKESYTTPPKVQFSDYKVTMNDFAKEENKPGKGFKLSYMFNVHGSDFKPTQNIYDEDKQTVIQYLRDPTIQEPRMRRQSNHEERGISSNMPGHA